MILDGVRIYDDGAGIDLRSQEKIRKIVSAVKNISPSAVISARFLKAGAFYEGMLWGTINNIPIGAYNRGPTMAHVLENLYRRVKKECFKIWRLNRSQLRLTGRNQANRQSPWSVAS
ncbi:hypothetical protein ACLVWU_04845 [Bdellovibrio sp. HCB290]|uniref:hypothetical protein n=1 Tax=Bdellovibrio sp. HCB290 TaxID=3394356 RepID=UPI0039B51AD3